MRVRQGLPWLVTVLLAIGVLAAVTAWVSAAGVNRGDALRTGGLAAGSVVALYALWLNDRRRRTEERRHELENERIEHDRERVADERFARAVELLGHEADQVRVGALHALAGLARSRPAYTQTVLDVLCSYLRRPFDHPRYLVTRGGELEPETDEWRKRREEADRWLQVRQTAQRLIADLLPAVSYVDVPRYDLDLSGATLEYFDISDRVVGQIRARRAHFYESTSLRGTVVLGPAWFTEATCWGRWYAPGVAFHDRCWFSKFEAHGMVDFAGARFGGDTKFADGVFGGPASFWGATFSATVDFTKARFRDRVDLRAYGAVPGPGMTVSLEHNRLLPDGWVVDQTRGTSFGVVRSGPATVT